MNLNKYKDNFIFVPLGGAKEIGMNLNLYHFQGKWIVIDMGIGFADDTLPGIDIVIPDPSFLEDIKKDILAIIITHAHEDHLGSVQYLWPIVKKPIYTSKFSGLFLKEKLREYNLHDKVKMIYKNIEEPFDIGPFTLEFFPINHSVPDMNAVIISTEKGNVFHTGDWKFDPNPVLGEPDNFKKLKKIGDRKIRALICDSTNIFNEKSSGSEGDLQKSLKKIIKQQKNMVVVGTFASNVGRLVSFVEAAKATDRKIVVCGRSLDRILDVALEMNYIKDTDVFISANKIKQYPRNKLMLLCTGCQGEERAALTRLAHDNYKNIKLQKNDTVIFSSKIIPGNELKIGKVLNALSKKQAILYTERDHFVHVSGHPGQEELKKMYSYIRPEIAIPVHGELMHINEHARFAENRGIKDVKRVTNGSVVILDKKPSEIIGEVENGYLAVDGNSLIDLNGTIIKQRKSLAESGIAIVNVKLDQKFKLIKPIDLRFIGVLDVNSDQAIINSIRTELERNISSNIKQHIKNPKAKKPQINEESFKKEIKSSLKKTLKQTLNKFSFIEVIVS